MSLRAVPGLAILAIGALASPVAARKLVFTPDEMRTDLAARLSADEMKGIEVPFEIDGEIRAWARSITEGIVSGQDQAEALARGILRDERLRAVYDESTTITAREVFRTGRANCISLTNLFIGILRDMGMPAYYVDVTDATKVRRVQDLMVARGHICAGVWFPGRFVLYDFADRPQRQYPRYTILDDHEALATFLLARTLNTILRDGPTDQLGQRLDAARRDTDLALKVKPGFAKAYVNLGTAHLRLGLRSEALALYGKALAADGQLVAAHLSMGYVYAQDGRWKESRDAYERAKELLPADALVRYHLGVAQYRVGELAGARRNLAAALEIDPELREAWSGLGLVRRALGDEAGAREAFLAASAAPASEAAPAADPDPAGDAPADDAPGLPVEPPDPR